MARKKGDIAITTVFIIVITLISIFLLLSLFAVKIPFFSKELYCKTFFHIQKSTFIPTGFRVDQAYCKDQEAMNVIKGNSSNAYEEISAAALGCWQIAQYGKMTAPVICTQIIYMPKADFEVTEYNVTERLISNKVCDLMPNDDASLSCGTGNSLTAKSLKFVAGSQKSILVEYDNNTRTVIIS